MEPLVASESRSFTRCAARHQEIDARFDLPGDEVAQGSIVERSILTEGSDQGGATSVQLHRDKIARIGGEENRQPANVRQSVKPTERYVTGQPMGGCPRSGGKTNAAD